MATDVTPSLAPDLPLLPTLGHSSPLLPSPGSQLQVSVPGSLSWRVPSPIQALEAVNRRLRELYPDSEDVFDIVLVTNNHAQVGVRLINSINHYGEHGGSGHGTPLPDAWGQGHTSAGSGKLAGMSSPVVCLAL